MLVRGAFISGTFNSTASFYVLDKAVEVFKPRRSEFRSHLKSSPGDSAGIFGQDISASHTNTCFYYPGISKSFYRLTRLTKWRELNGSDDALLGR